MLHQQVRGTDFSVLLFTLGRGCGGGGGEGCRHVVLERVLVRGMRGFPLRGVVGGVEVVGERLGFAVAHGPVRGKAGLGIGRLAGG